MSKQMKNLTNEQYQKYLCYWYEALASKEFLRASESSEPEAKPNRKHIEYSNTFNLSELDSGLEMPDVFAANKNRYKSKITGDKLVTLKSWKEIENLYKGATEEVMEVISNFCNILKEVEGIQTAGGYKAMEMKKMAKK